MKKYNITIFVLIVLILFFLNKLIHSKAFNPKISIGQSAHAEVLVPVAKTNPKTQSLTPQLALNHNNTNSEELFSKAVDSLEQNFDETVRCVAKIENCKFCVDGDPQCTKQASVFEIEYFNLIYGTSVTNNNELNREKIKHGIAIFVDKDDENYYFYSSDEERDKFLDSWLAYNRGFNEYSMKHPKLCYTNPLNCLSAIDLNDSLTNYDKKKIVSLIKNNKKYMDELVSEFLENELNPPIVYSSMNTLTSKKWDNTLNQFEKPWRVSGAISEGSEGLTSLEKNSKIEVPIGEDIEIASYLEDYNRDMSQNLEEDKN